MKTKENTKQIEKQIEVANRIKSIELEVEKLKVEKEKLHEILNNSKEESILDRIKTFEDVCIVSGTTISAFNKKNKNNSEDNQAYEKLKLIVKALNEDWFPNWNDSNESKYYPYFRAGFAFGFSCTAYHYGTTFTSVGSRLCFRTEELAEYAGKQFESIYRAYMM